MIGAPAEKNNRVRTLWICLLALLMVYPVTVSRSTVAAVVVSPEYARWGALAMKETRERYKAAIIDYKHIGRSVLSSARSEERFKLWVRDSRGKEFGVYVYIQFNPSTNAVHSIRFTETDR